MTPQTKKYLWLAARVLVSGACIAWVVWRVDFRDVVQDIGEVFSQGRWPWLIAAVVAGVVPQVISAWRWHLLMKVQRVHMTFGAAFRLTYIGSFFNTFMLGMTGGDFVKAFYAAKQTERKAEAVTTVFLDRVVGIFAMGLLCLIALACNWDDPALAQGKVRQFVVLFVAGSIGGGLIFYSHRIRRWLFLEKLLRKLPFQQMVTRLDEAVFLYRYHGKLIVAAILQSWAAHLCNITCAYLGARALGLDPSPFYFVAYLPAIWIMAAFLPTVGALGPLEVLTQHYFSSTVLGLGPALTAAIKQEALRKALAIALLFRAAQFTAVLPGGLLNVLRPEVSLKEAEQRPAAEELPHD